MSKRILLVLAPFAVVTFVYLHFEYFPAHGGPDLKTAQSDVNRWAQEVSRQSNCDLRVKKVRAVDDEGMAIAEVEVRYLYYEADGLAQRYAGPAEVAFVRAGRMFRPSWNIANVKLLDKQQTLGMK